MALTEFIAEHAASQILPLVGRMSDRNLGRLLSVARQVAPTDYARLVLDALDRMNREHHPTIELLKRVYQQTSPRTQKCLINSLLIQGLMRGNIIREQLRSQGLVAPQTFLISPTMRCNLRCRGCYAGNYNQKDRLDFEVIDRIISEGKELGISWLTILGGEPFLRQDLLEIYRKHHDVFFQIFTNGTLIDKEMARRMGKLGNVLAIFGVDGFEQETDARRGVGVFQKVMEGMDNLRGARVAFGFSSTVARHNVETILSDEFNDMLIEKGCLVGWHFLYLPVGRDADISLMPSVAQRELMRRRGAPRIRNEKPLLVIDFWNDAPFVGGCIAGGRNYFHINANGDVEPCIFVHLAVDNIVGKSLTQVMESPYFKAIRDRQPFSENLLRPCMIIDHPQVLRNLAYEYRPYPTDGQVYEPLSVLADELDKYSSESACILDPVWERDFASARGLRGLEPTAS